MAAVFRQSLPPVPALLVVLACLVLTPCVLLIPSYLPSLSGSAARVNRRPAADAAIVIVHLGDGKHVDGIPQQQTEQIADNVEQIRLFNPHIPIYIVVDPILKLTAQEALRLAANAVLITTDTLQPTPEHLHWQQNSSLVNRTERNNFWRYASERFFYLSDVAVQRGLKNIIHIEYDTLIYIDLNTVLPVLQRFYQAGAVFDHPKRCIPGFMFFSSAVNVVQLAQYMSQHANQNMDDMAMVAQYRTEHPDKMLPLPIFDPASYPDPIDELYATHLKEFGCVFDGAAYGQYLGGVDPRNKPGNSTGFVNEMCLVKPDKVKLEWRQDQGLWAPYMNGLRIANLHIHSKNTKRWRSDRGQMHKRLDKL